jgi:Zn-dependent protease/CBS domain-containing protein
VPGSLRIARLFGIEVRIHVSWLIIFGLLLVQLADPTNPAGIPVLRRGEAYLVATITALLFFASVVTHELAHSLVARAFRMPVSSITLFMLGGVANLAKEPPRALAEFLMAIAGPLTSALIGIVGIGLALIIDRTLTPSITTDTVAAAAQFLGRVNLSLAVFNLLPGFPLDGGRVLRSVVWGIAHDRSRATRIAARGGQVVAGLLFLAAIWLFFSESLAANGIWIALIAYFLYNAASQSLEQERVTSAVAGVSVATLMATQFNAVHPRTSLADLAFVHMLPNNARAVAVVDGGRLIGMVTIADLRKVDQQAWPQTRAESVMRPASAIPSVKPSSRLMTAIERFSATDLPVLPVEEDDVLVGMLEREAVGSYVRMREMLGLDARR